MLQPHVKEVSEKVRAKKVDFTRLPEGMVAEMGGKIKDEPVKVGIKK
jgi:hypothetical protein